MAQRGRFRCLLFFFSHPVRQVISDSQAYFSNFFFFFFFFFLSFLYLLVFRLRGALSFPLLLPFFPERIQGIPPSPLPPSASPHPFSFPLSFSGFKSRDPIDEKFYRASFFSLPPRRNFPPFFPPFLEKKIGTPLPFFFFVKSMLANSGPRSFFFPPLPFFSPKKHQGRRSGSDSTLLLKGYVLGSPRFPFSFPLSFFPPFFLRMESKVYRAGGRGFFPSLFL